MLFSNHKHPEVEAVAVPQFPTPAYEAQRTIFCWALHTQKQRAWWDTSLLWKAHIKALKLVTALLAFASPAPH